MALKTTLGQLLVNQALPEGLRDYGRVLDKPGISALLRKVAQDHPDQYREVSKRLADIGRVAATESGGNSFGLAHMRKSRAGAAVAKELQDRINQILDDDTLDDDARNEKVIGLTESYADRQQREVYEESLAEKNPLAVQLTGAGRGNKSNLSSLRGSDLLYQDHRDNKIPLPVLRSYSQGLTPAEYWAGTYGARKGVMDVKFATQDAGFLSKQLNQVSHRLMVVDLDGDGEPDGVRGMPVDTDDPDNEGALLAHDVGPYKRNSVLTPKALKHLKELGQDRIVVRSPVVGGSPEGGVYGRDVGVREAGVIPGAGEQVGLQAAQALSEPISQGMLSSKHSGGVVGAAKGVGGFQSINQQIQTPKTFKGGAAHAQVDGRVSSVEKAPAGGHYVTVDGQRHYVAEGYGLKVKPGDLVEAGDVLSEGLPNPAEVVEHKGVGEGRRYFVSSMRRAMQDAGMKVHRRNLELLARGLINHVVLTDEHGGHLPDDVVPYSTLEHTWEPRDGHQRVDPRQALGKFLEAPVLHYTVGTKVRPSVLQDLQKFGVAEVAVHPDPPPFRAQMIRGMASLQHDPDPFTRMYGSGQKRSLQDAVYRGRTSTELGTSFVPGLMKAVDFGRVGLVRQPQPGTKPDPPAASPAVAADVKPSAPRTTPPTADDGGKASPAQPKTNKSWGSLLKWSAERRLPGQPPDNLNGPAQAGVPAPASPRPPTPGVPAPPRTPPATAYANPPAAPPRPAPPATAGGLADKARQNYVENGGFSPARQSDPSRVWQAAANGGGVADVASAVDPNAWATLTGQANVRGPRVAPQQQYEEPPAPQLGGQPQAPQPSPFGMLGGWGANVAAWAAAKETLLQATRREMARRTGEAATRAAARQAVQTSTAEAVKKVVPTVAGRGLVRLSGGPLATPVNALLEVFDTTVGTPTWVGGQGLGNPTQFAGKDFDRKTTADGSVFGLDDPTQGALSYLGAGFNAWSRPIQSTWTAATTPYAVGATGLRALARDYSPPPARPGAQPQSRSVGMARPFQDAWTAFTGAGNREGWASPGTYAYGLAEGGLALADAAARAKANLGVAVHDARHGKPTYQSNLRGIDVAAQPPATAPDQPKPRVMDPSTTSSADLAAAAEAAKAEGNTAAALMLGGMVGQAKEREARQQGGRPPSLLDPGPGVRRVEQPPPGWGSLLTPAGGGDW